MMDMKEIDVKEIIESEKDKSHDIHFIPREVDEEKIPIPEKE